MCMLICVCIDDVVCVDCCVIILMGDKVEFCRKWIESNVVFGLEEDLNILDNENVLMVVEEDV